MPTLCYFTKRDEMKCERVGFNLTDQKVARSTIIDLATVCRWKTGFCYFVRLARPTGRC